ncbi:MAG: creatininase family protein [Gemmatimonadota bacterium]|jgi:creatinine amidohydrolase
MDDREIQLEHMTWPEVERAVAEGWRTAVFACGAVEQHGPHLPLFMDAEHGTALAVAVARRLGHTLVAPTVRVGCSEHHMDFPGTLTLARDTFQAVVRDYVSSLARHGFDRVLVLPSHGGNFRPLAEALPELRRVAGEESSAPGGTTEVRAYTDFRGFLDVWKRAVESAGGAPEQVGGHADLAETSIMALLHPELVREDHAEAGYTGPTDAALLERIFRDGFRSVTPVGVLGDPRGMTPGIGRRCIEEAARHLATFFDSPEDA